jgi:hypothetical protein
MIAKFLFGTNRTIPNGQEDSPTGVKYKDTLLIVRKHDLFQHADMAKFYRLSPSTGGFVKKLGIKQGEEHFYGESVSCRVQTDDSMLELYHDLIKNGDWFKHTYIYNEKTPFTVFCCVQKDHYPSSLLNGVEWEPVQYEEIKPLMRKEIEENVSPFFR